MLALEAAEAATEARAMLLLLCGGGALGLWAAGAAAAMAATAYPRHDVLHVLPCCSDCLVALSAFCWVGWVALSAFCWVSSFFFGFLLDFVAAIVYLCDRVY